MHLKSSSSCRVCLWSRKSSCFSQDCINATNGNKLTKINDTEQLSTTFSYSRMLCNITLQLALGLNTTGSIFPVLLAVVPAHYRCFTLLLVPFSVVREKSIASARAKESEKRCSAPKILQVHWALDPPAKEWRCWNRNSTFSQGWELSATFDVMQIINWTGMENFVLNAWNTL